MAESPSTVRVTYWNGRGRCEPNRVILAASGVKFEQRFLSKPEEMEALRKDGKLFYDQLPLVEIDGLNLVQSGAQARYLAKRGGFYPDNPKDAYLVEMIYEGTRDARGPATSYPFHMSMEKTKSGLNFERIWNRWEKLLSNSKSGYFLEKPSLADLTVFEALDGVQQVLGDKEFGELFKDCPNLLKMKAQVLKLGNLEEYIREQRKSQLSFAEYAKAVDTTLSRN